VPEDQTDWENVRRQALATLKIANRKLNRAPSDMTDRASSGVNLGVDMTTILLVDNVSGRVVGRIVDVRA